MNLKQNMTNMRWDRTQTENIIVELMRIMEKFYDNFCCLCTYALATMCTSARIVLDLCTY